MFEINYKKKIEKLIIGKTMEVELLEKMTQNYEESSNFTEEKANFVKNMIADISKEIISCQVETEFTKEKYLQHKNKFKEILKNKEGEYYGKKEKK